MSTAIQKLTQAWKATGITKDDNTVAKCFEANAEKGKLLITLTAIESKYVPKFDKRDLEEGQGAGNLGFRTRFFTKEFGSLGSFSNAAHTFYGFFAALMGQDSESTFGHIDIAGEIKLVVTKVPLDGGKTTYNFEIEEEGSTLEGFNSYALPSSSEILALNEPAERQVGIDTQFVDTNTGELMDEDDVQAALEQASAATIENANRRR